MHKHRQCSVVYGISVCRCRWQRWHTIQHTQFRMVVFWCQSIRHIVQFSRFSTVEVTVSLSLCVCVTIYLQLRSSRLFTCILSLLYQYLCIEVYVVDDRLKCGLCYAWSYSIFRYVFDLHIVTVHWNEKIELFSRLLLLLVLFVFGRFKYGGANV